MRTTRKMIFNSISYLPFLCRSSVDVLAYTVDNFIDDMFILSEAINSIGFET